MKDMCLSYTGNVAAAELCKRIIRLTVGSLGGTGCFVSIPWGIDLLDLSEG